MLAFLAAAPPSPASPPRQAALARAAERVRTAMVEVSGARRRGPGVIVGTGGEILTCTAFVRLDSATVRQGLTTLKGAVRMANARLGVALVTVPAPTPWPALPVELTAVPSVGEWVVGVGPNGKGDWVPRAGRVFEGPKAGAPFLGTTLSLPLGSPVLDVRGRLLGIVVGRSKTGSRVLPMLRVKQELARAEGPK